MLSWQNHLLNKKKFEKFMMSTGWIIMLCLHVDYFKANYNIVVIQLVVFVFVDPFFLMFVNYYNDKTRVRTTSSDKPKQTVNS
jgi:phosphotransferase system  glucose/maltose/N-acetylglucosamine-specific IIC component